MSPPIFSNHEIFRLYLELQMAIAISSPDHLDHLRDEEGRINFTPNELLEHFAGMKDPRDVDLFAGQYKKLFLENWEKIDSSDNRWYAGEMYSYSPSAFQAALYFFAVAGLFRLRMEMIPEIITAMEKAKHQTLVA